MIKAGRQCRGGEIVRRSSEKFFETSTVLDKELSDMRYGGPYGSGKWIVGRNQVGLGHVRLAIVDLKSGYSRCIVHIYGTQASIKGRRK